VNGENLAKLETCLIKIDYRQIHFLSFLSIIFVVLPTYNSNIPLLLLSSYFQRYLMGFKSRHQYNIKITLTIHTFS